MVWAVVALVAGKRHTFVKMDAEIFHRADDQRFRALHPALVVRVLNAQQKFSAALMRQTLVDQRTVEIADVDESRWAWAQTCDHRSFRKIARRIARLKIVHRRRHIRKQTLSELFVVHIYPPLRSSFTQSYLL